MTRQNRRFLCIALATSLLALAGCIEDDQRDGRDAYATLEQAAAVPGMWDPPASTEAIAATQYVNVVEPPTVSPDGYCTSNNAFDCSCVHPACTPALPGTQALDQYIRNRWGYVGYGGLFCCRQNSATQSTPRLSVHAIGRAMDLMIPMAGNDADNGLGDPVANWLVENAEFIGVQRIVWDRAYWNGERGFGPLGSNSSPHTNHLHVELSIAGANAQTPFFTTGAVNGTCTPRCEGTKLINEDCSTQECATNGAQCLSGPPRCGEPPPPEPDAAEAVAGATPPSVTTIGGSTRFNYIDALRLFDTRQDALSSNLARAGGGTSGPMIGGGANVYTPPNGTFPADTTTAWINLAAINAAENGFVTIAPAGSPEPPTSNLNFLAGEVRANAAPAPLGNGDGIAFYPRIDVNAIADLTGAFAPTGEGLAIDGPKRVFDSRSSTAPFAAGETRAIPVDAPSDATGVVGSIAVIGGDGPGHVIVHECGKSVPEVSTVNHTAGTVVANGIMTPLVNGEICVTSNVAEGVHVILDVAGYLSPDGPLSYQALQPQRLLDTRQDDSLWTNRLANGQTIELPVGALAGMPDGVWAAAVNIVTVGATDNGFLTAHPCGGAVPNTSSLNFGAGRADSAFSTVPVGTDEELCIYAHSRAHVIVDLVGVWVHDESALPPTPPDDTTPEDGGDEGGPIDPPDTMDEDPGSDVANADMTAGSDSSISAPDGAMSTATSNTTGGTTSGTAGQDPAGNSASGGCCRVAARKPVGGDGAPLAALFALGGVLAFVRRRRKH